MTWAHICTQMIPRSIWFVSAVNDRTAARSYVKMPGWRCRLDALQSAATEHHRPRSAGIKAAVNDKTSVDCPATEESGCRRLRLRKWKEPKKNLSLQTWKWEISKLSLQTPKVKLQTAKVKIFKVEISKLGLQN